MYICVREENIAYCLSFHQEAGEFEEFSVILKSGQQKKGGILLNVKIGVSNARKIYESQ